MSRRGVSPGFAAETRLLSSSLLLSPLSSLLARDTHLSCPRNRHSRRPRSSRPVSITARSALQRENNARGRGSRVSSGKRSLVKTGRPHRPMNFPREIDGKIETSFWPQRLLLGSSPYLGCPAAFRKAAQRAFPQPTECCSISVTTGCTGALSRNPPLPISLDLPRRFTGN